MKILMIGHSADGTGAPLSMLQLARALTSMGHELNIGLRRPGRLLTEYQSVAPVHVLRDDHTDMKARDLVDTAFRYDPLLALKCSRNPDRPFCLPIDDLNSVRDWVRDVRAWGPDWIYVNTSHCGDLLEHLRQLQCPLITHVREMRATLEALDRKRFKTFRDDTDHFLAASEAVRDDLIEVAHIRPEMISVEAPAMSFDEERLQRASERIQSVESELGLQPGDLLVIGVGTPCEWKGTDLFIEACQAARKHLPDDRRLVCLWIGGGEKQADMDRYQVMISEGQHATDIRFVGQVDDPFPYYALANAHLLCSREDPNPRVVMEAAALGTYTLSFDENGGAPDFIRTFEAGALVSFLDTVEMGERLAELLKGDTGPDHALAERVKSERDVTKSADRIVTVAQRLIDLQSARDQESAL